MDALNAKPGLLKQANLTEIRCFLREKGTATRAEIAEGTRISGTTVRALLCEMLEDGEIESVGRDASSGGRRAERYGLRRDRYYGAAVCIAEGKLHGLLVDVYGQVVESVLLDAPEEEAPRAVFNFLDGVTARHEIRAIGVGAPGVADGDGFLRKRAQEDALHRVDIGRALRERYGLPVVLENDLIATTLGFGRCYAREFPEEDPEHANMAYLYFEPGCVSAGFIVGGRIVRGINRFAGEIGLVPMLDERPLDEWMAEPMDDARYIACVTHIAGWVCGMLNPQYVALGGPGLRRDCVAAVGEGLSALLPGPMQAEILYASDRWHDYRDGMAYLTAQKMMNRVKIVKA